MSAVPCLVRQRAAAESKAWAKVHSGCQGWAGAMAILLRRTLIRTRAPIFSSLRRVKRNIGKTPCSLWSGGQARRYDICQRRDSAFGQNTEAIPEVIPE